MPSSGETSDDCHECCPRGRVQEVPIPINMVHLLVEGREKAVETLTE